MKKTPNDIPVVEGEKLEVHCKVAGTDPKIQWTAGNWVYSSMNEMDFQ